MCHHRVVRALRLGRELAAAAVCSIGSQRLLIRLSARERPSDLQEAGVDPNMAVASVGRFVFPQEPPGREQGRPAGVDGSPQGQRSPPAEITQSC